MRQNTSLLLGTPKRMNRRDAESAEKSLAQRPPRLGGEAVFLASLAALFLVPLASLHAANRTNPTNKPNILLIMTDDQGYGEMSCHGNPVLKTPHLDRLHGEGIRFADFHVAPMCTPTRGQLMTGVDVLRNLAMNVSSGRTLLRRDLPTMADIFASAGYGAGIFGKWHLGDNYPYRPQDRGFQESLWYPSSHIGSAPDYWDNDYFDDTYWHNGRRRQFTGYTTDVFFREAMRWMREQAQSGRPFFCYLPTAAPHGPHFVPASYREAMEAAAAKAAPPKLQVAAREQLTRYLAMIANIDENMGRLETFLRETGLRENTIVVFLTDNGSTFGPRYFNVGMRSGKTTLWEGGHRVPCFIRWPAGRLRSPGDVAGLAQVQDLLPTLLDLAGVKAPANAQFDGISLAGALRGTAQMPLDRTLIVQFSRMDHQEPERGDACVMWRRWRLVQDKELYDLTADPAQERNVIAEHPDIAARLRAYYASWWETVAPRLNEPQRVIIGHDAEPRSQLSPCEWRDSFLDQGAQVRRGERRNGVWYLEVARAGEYEFELRRWAREREAPLSAGLPPKKITDGEFPAGTALPIAKARLKTGPFDHTVAVAATDTSVKFRVPLDVGPTELQTWFYNDSGEELCGAYYVYVQRLQTSPPVKIVLDTDMSGDCDDTGALALLHALADRERPNIVFFLIDDCSTHEFGCYGNKSNRTPNVDRLAASGIRFNTAWATPLCVPTRALLLSGQYGFKTGIYYNAGIDPAKRGDLPNRITPLSRTLQQAGYATFMGGKWHLEGLPGEKAWGFDEYCLYGSLCEAVRRNRDWVARYKGPWWPATWPNRTVLSKPEGRGNPYATWHPMIIRNGEFMETGPDDFGPEILSRDV
ncbi:sulfatase-like hydrolase/transferase, partial [Candidatus Sumerlaeota bacterium]|nr:sulfatase-like hydrolase/transferase [Candidatus Sumerlaeota bacterium]